MKNTDKELMRRFKAETVGRLIALGTIFIGFMLFADKKEDATNASVPRDVHENMTAQQAYADSVRNMNAFKIDTLQSRVK